MSRLSPNIPSHQSPVTRGHAHRPSHVNRYGAEGSRSQASLPRRPTCIPRVPSPDGPRRRLSHAVPIGHVWFPECFSHGCIRHGATLRLQSLREHDDGRLCLPSVRVRAPVCGTGSCHCSCCCSPAAATAAAADEWVQPRHGAPHAGGPIAGSGGPPAVAAAAEWVLTPCWWTYTGPPTHKGRSVPGHSGAEWVPASPAAAIAAAGGVASQA